MHRQDVNRDIRAKKAVIADIGSSLPINYDGERWDVVRKLEWKEKCDPAENEELFLWNLY